MAARTARTGSRPADASALEALVDAATGILAADSLNDTLSRIAHHLAELLEYDELSVYEVDWGEAGQGASSCTIVKGRDADRHRRGKQRRLHASYTFESAGDQHVTVRALSGGCTAQRPEQRSAARMVHIRVD